MAQDFPRYISGKITSGFNVKFLIAVSLVSVGFKAQKRNWTAASTVATYRR
jgi:hypothetical protein